MCGVFYKDIFNGCNDDKKYKKKITNQLINNN